MQVFLQGQDLFTEQSNLLVVTLDLEATGLGQLVGYGAVIDVDDLLAVELATKVVNADDAGGSFAHDPESGPHDVTEVALLTGDLMSTWDSVKPEESSKCCRVDLIGLDLGIGNGFKVLGMSENELDAVGFEEIVEPVPSCGALDNGSLWSIERCEVGEDGDGNIGQSFLAHLFSEVIDSGDETIIFV